MHILQPLEIYPKKARKLRHFNLKQVVFGISIHIHGIISKCSYVHAHFLLYHIKTNFIMLLNCVQSGASSPAKHGDAYFSAVYGSIKDPIAAPGLYENQEP